MPTFTFFPTNGGEYDGHDGAGLENNTGSGNNYTQGAADNDVSIMTFDSNAIRSALAGYNITSITIDFTVLSKSTGTNTAYWGSHNYTSVPSNVAFSRIKQNRATLAISATGRVTGFTLPAALGAELRDGTSTGLIIGPCPSSVDPTANHLEIAAQDTATGTKPVLTIVAVLANSAPNAPTLNTPAAGAVADGANNSISFGWTASDPNGDPMTAWYFRRNKGGGVFDYWNGTSFVSTETRLTTATVSLPGGLMVVPATKWANGQSYSWSVATEDPAGLKGPYAADRILYTSTAPTTTVTAPADNSNATVARPTITWTFADTDGQAQYAWTAMIVAAEDYTEPTFDPDTNNSAKWTKTVTNSTAASTTITTDLINHTTYRAYVKVGSSPNPSAGIQWSNWAYHTFTVVIPPFAPVVTYPQNGSSVDLAQTGFTLDWTDTFFSGIGSQTAFAIRRQTGGGAYQWWNGSWGSTEAFLPGSASQYTFRSGEVTNGSTYTFAVAIRDDFSQTSPYGSGATVTGISLPQTTIIAPVGTTVTARPTVTWTLYQAENNPQQTYQVKIIKSSVVGSSPGTFDPTSVTADWDTGEVTDALTRNVVLGVDLVNSTDYYVFARAKAIGLYSSWAYSEFNISLVPPGTPSVSTNVENDHGKIDVIFQGRDNMLTDVASRCADGWMPMDVTGNCTITQGVFLASAQSHLMVQVAATSAGSMMAHTMDPYPVQPGFVYSAAISMLAPVGTAAVNCYVVIHWLDADGDIIISTYGQSFSDMAAVRSLASAPAPAGAVSARIGGQFENVQHAGDVHQLFDPVFRPSLGDEWSPGGLVGQTTATFTEALTGRPLRFGTDVPIPTLTQQITLPDEESAIGDTVQYGVTTRAVYPTAVLTSPQALSTPTSWTSGFLWLSNPVVPGTSYLFNPVKWGDQVRPMRQGKFRPLGRPDAVLVTGVRGLREGSFTIMTYTSAERIAFANLIANSDILLLRCPPDQGETVADAIYIRPQTDAPESRPLDNRTTHRTITMSWVEQLMPMDNIEYVAE